MKTNRFLFSLFLLPLIVSASLYSAPNRSTKISSLGVGVIKVNSNVGIEQLRKRFPGFVAMQRSCPDPNIRCFEVSQYQGPLYLTFKVDEKTNRPLRIDIFSQDFISPAGVTVGTSYENLLNHDSMIECSQSATEGLINCIQPSVPNIIYQFDVSEFPRARTSTKPLDRSLLAGKKCSLYWMAHGN